MFQAIGSAVSGVFSSIYFSSYIPLSLAGSIYLAAAAPAVAPPSPARGALRRPPPRCRCRPPRGTWGPGIGTGSDGPPPPTRPAVQQRPRQDRARPPAKLANGKVGLALL